jgi:hypothetical protein
MPWVVTKLAFTTLSLLVTKTCTAICWIPLLTLNLSYQWCCCYYC